MLILKHPIQKDGESVEVGYAIDGDDMNIILYKLGIAQKGNNAGQQTKFVLGYFTSIENVLQRIYSLEVGLVGFEDLEALHERVSSTIALCVSNLGKLNYIRGEIK